MEKKNNTLLPKYQPITAFLKGQASKLFKEVNENDDVIIVNKQSKPYTVVISYERYIKLKNDGADI
ncbi:MAG: type II toxin-antitoxin system prevent-host-death family antitoxin [Eubacteriales bacterium]|nr:type II toxin-antitoxin system prevent-host-death family antitoxin [Eubacteriales bacterium]